MLVAEMMYVPPPVTRAANQPITTDELLEHCRNDNIGKIMTTKKQ
jgi:hypothetical protein